jgi:hypothetical protein
MLTFSDSPDQHFAFLCFPFFVQPNHENPSIVAGTRLKRFAPIAELHLAL